MQKRKFSEFLEKIRCGNCNDYVQLSVNPEECFTFLVKRDTKKLVGFTMIDLASSILCKKCQMIIEEDEKALNDIKNNIYMKYSEEQLNM